MQTIKSLIVEKQSYLKAQREIMLEDRMEAVYSSCPELRKIDIDIVEVRKSKILAMIEDNDNSMPVLNKREEDLIKERAEVISKNNIDPHFDEEIPTCDKCNDTGFVTTPGGLKIVCTDCMSHELTKCYDYCGMEDYQRYTLKAYKHDYFGDKVRRKSVFEAVKKIFESANSGSHGLYLYSDKIQSGKTYLAVILTKYAIIEGISAAFTKAEDIGNFEDYEIDFFKSCEFLVIDDYAPEITRDWRKSSALNSVIEARIAEGLPTLLVSISPKESLVADSEVRLSGKISRAVVL